MRLRCTATIGALALSVALAVSTADAQLVNPFGKTDPGLIDGGDLDNVRGSIRSVLDAYKVGATHQWHSAKTNRSGVAIMIDTFKKNGLKCAHVTHRITEGRGNTYTAPFCQVAEGTWKLAF